MNYRDAHSTTMWRTYDDALEKERAQMLEIIRKKKESKEQK